MSCHDDDGHSHSHYGEYAGVHHRHYDTESEIRGLREDLSRAEDRIRELEDQHARGIARLWACIGDMPGGI